MEVLSGKALAAGSLPDLPAASALPLTYIKQSEWFVKAELTFACSRLHRHGTRSTGQTRSDRPLAKVV